MTGEVTVMSVVDTFLAFERERAGTDLRVFEGRRPGG
jgi:hypothetical protein